MEKTHFSLGRRANLAFIVVWGLGAAGILAVASPRPLLATSIGAACGLVAGLLQRASIHGNPMLFGQAKSGLDVRRAFMSNRPGQVSIVLMWAAAAVLVAIGFAGAASPFAVVTAGYLAFMFVRDLTALGAIRSVEKAVPGGQHAF